MRIFHVLILILVFVLFSACKEEVKLEVEKENIKQVLDQWTESFETEDIELFKKIMLQDENIVVFGTDEAERWVGLADLLKAVQQQFDSFDKMNWKVKNQIIGISNTGESAWFSQVVDVTVIVKQDTIDFKGMRMTGVLDKIDDSWKIVQFHNSVGIEGQAIEY